MSGAFFGREPHDAFAWMRANAPVYYDEPNDLWAAASYAAVKQASVDTESFSSAQGIRPKSPQLPMMIDFDAPEHVRRRRLVSEGFTPRRVRDLEGKLRAGLRRAHRQGLRDGSLRLRQGPRGAAAHHRDRRHARRRTRGPRRPAALVRRHAQGARARPTPRSMDNAATAFVEYTDYIHPVFDDRRATHNTSDLVGVLCHARDRRRFARRRLARPRDAAHPHRRRRDDPPRHQRRHGGAPGPPGPGGPALGRSGRAHAGGGRGDAALGVADQEHGPHRDAGRRTGRGAHRRRPGDPPAVPVGQPRRGRLRERRGVRHHAPTPTRTWPSASARTSASATSWRAWSCA